MSFHKKYFMVIKSLYWCHIYAACVILWAITWYFSVSMCMFACMPVHLFCVLFSFKAFFSFCPCLLIYDQWRTDSTHLTVTFPDPVFCTLMYASVALFPWGHMSPCPLLVFSVPRHTGLAERLPARNGMWDVYRNFVPLFHWDDISTSQRVSCHLLAI